MPESKSKVNNKLSKLWNWLIENPDKVLAAVITLILGSLGFIYSQPLILSIFLFISIAIIAIPLKLLHTDDLASIFIMLVISFLISIDSYIFPDESQFVLLFTPITLFAYLLIPGIISNLSYLISDHKKYFASLKKRSKDGNFQIGINSPFFPASQIMYSFFVFFSLLLPFLTGKIDYQYNDFLALSKRIIVQIFSLRVSILLLACVFILILVDKKLRENLLKMWRVALIKGGLMYFAFIVVVLLSIFTPLILNAIFFTLYNSNIIFQIQSNFKVCQLSNTTYELSGINPFLSTCYVKVYYSNEQFPLKYFVFPSQYKTFSQFELAQSNKTVQYNVLCNNFNLGFLQSNVPIC